LTYFYGGKNPEEETQVACWLHKPLIRNHTVYLDDT